MSQGIIYKFKKNMPNDKNVFHGYGYAIRTFRFDVESLQNFRWWGEKSFDKYETKLKKRIHGTGTVERDSICIIGTDIRTRQFEVNIGSDETASEDWELFKGEAVSLCSQDDTENEIFSRADAISKRCAEKAPTSFLGYTEADRELGIVSGWWCEIKIPNFVLEQLEQDIAVGKANKIRIGVKWIGGLVLDEYAPPAADNTWGLMRDAGRKSPEVMRGYVTSIGWGATASVSNKESLNPLAESKVTPKPDANTQAITALSQAVVALSQRVNAAFIAAIIVIVFTYLLR